MLVIKTPGQNADHQLGSLFRENQLPRHRCNSDNGRMEILEVSRKFVIGIWGRS
jgi:hypothetical protein